MGKSLSLVVAVDRELGIGKAGTIPWRVPADMRHFKRLTKTTLDPSTRNAVIMGRKTWESIPVEFRPLEGRLNVVLTRNPQPGLPDGVWRASNFDGALDQLSSASEVAQLFVIGGGQVYAQALAHPDCLDVFITRLDQVFDCDTRFPEFDQDFALCEQLQRGISGDVGYRIEHWRRPTEVERT